MRTLFWTLKFLLMAPMVFAFEPKGGEKPSLKAWGLELKDSKEITELYKQTLATMKPNPASKKIVKKYTSYLERLEKAFAESQPFVRGEIEEESTLDSLLVALQLMCLKTRELAEKNEWLQVEKHNANWFLFAADLPYEEASIVSLPTAAVLRTLLLIELESLQKIYKKEIAQSGALRPWLLQVRAPWPVDRVILFEAKRRLPSDLHRVAEKVAKAYQKNPYETSEKALKDAKAQDIKEAELLKKIWKTSDIEVMKAEMNQFGSLKLRLALAEFEFKNKRRPKTVGELVEQRLIDRAPIDYMTGKPLELPAD